MAQGRLIGQNYTTPDLVAKVTGRARYAEDYRAEGMLFCKLLLSPMPHCRIRRIDTAAALAIPGVRAVLTADDLPPVKAAEGGLPPERALTNEPVYQGEPVLAVAAVDEWTAAEAIEAITVDVDPLPFVVDPIASLRPGGANAREQGNAFVDGKVATVKWPADVFAAAGDGMLPLGEPRHAVGVRRRRGRLPRRRAGARRDLPHQRHRARAARDALGDGLLAERQALPARLDAERRPDGGVGGPLGRCRRGAGRHRQRVHRRRLRQQDSRRRTRWRSRRCCRRSSDCR